jgi:hypothetical protein
MEKTEIEETLEETKKAFFVAFRTGDYKKANEFLDVLEGKKEE